MRVDAVGRDLLDALAPFVLHDDDDIEYEDDRRSGERNTVRIRVTHDEYLAARAAYGLEGVEER